MKIKFLEYITLKKIRIRTIIILAIAIIMFLLLFSSYGIINRMEFYSKRNQSRKELILYKSINDSLLKRINDLKYDTLEIERVAREKYGMIRKGEKVYMKKNK